jgi:hypothetical protein
MIVFLVIWTVAAAYCTYKALPSCRRDEVSSDDDDSDVELLYSDPDLSDLDCDDE